MTYYDNVDVKAEFMCYQGRIIKHNMLFFGWGSGKYVEI